MMWGAIINLFFGSALLAIPSIVKKVFLTLGVGFVVYQGAQTLLDTLKAYILAEFSHLGAVPIAGQIVGVLNIDLAVTNIISALAIRLFWDYIKGKYLTFGSPTLS